MIDEQKLRELCSNATPGPWYLRTNRHPETDGRPWGWLDTKEPGSGSQAPPLGVSVTWTRGERSEANARFIASANPATITALLDELQSMRSERTAWRVTAENAEAELKLISEMNDQLREQNTAVDEACAKLEAAIEANTPAVTASASVAIDYRQAVELVEMFGGEPAEVRLIHGDGHSGLGLYAYYDELPEDGANFLGETDPDASPQPQPVAQPLDPWSVEEDYFAWVTTSATTWDAFLAGVRLAENAHSIKPANQQKE